MVDLHSALRAVIEQRLEVARAAEMINPSPWKVEIDNSVSGESGCLVEDDGLMTEQEAMHIALHDPADAIRRYRNELELLDHYARLDAESEGNLTHDEIFERNAQLELLRDLISDLLDVYPEVTRP